MSTEVTPDLLRQTANGWICTDNAADEYGRHYLRQWADHLEREQRPLPTVPGWYPGIVVERGGESCTGALLADDDGWRTAREVGGCYGHWTEGNSDLTIRWAEQDGTTPGQTLWEADSGNPAHTLAWSALPAAVKDRYERIAAAVLAVHGTPTLTPVGEHPEPGTRGLLPLVVGGSGAMWLTDGGGCICGVGARMVHAILADPRPDGAHE